MLGLRVVRGPDWSWRDEDGGEGYMGTLYHADTTNKTAIIQWDNGIQTLCKIGQMHTYELRIVDNAQIGVKHNRVECDECSSSGVRINSYEGFESLRFGENNEEDIEHKHIQCNECRLDNIRGIRYKCLECYDYDLCEHCYQGKKHELTHTFIRIVSPNCEGIVLPARSEIRKTLEQEIIHRGIHCDGCNSRNIRGIRYKCNNCHDYDLCDLCYHRNKHDLTHSFRKIISPKSGSIDLPPRISSKRDLKADPAHAGVRCDECNVFGIHGMRYKCKNCFNYDLCESCYHGNKHDVSHSFIRIDFPTNLGVYLSPRIVSNQTQDAIHTGIHCDACNFDDIEGPRYKCNNCYNYDLCSFCYYENKHDLSHRFSRISTPNSERIDLPPRLRLRYQEDSMHRGIQCDECYSHNICGIRYKCNICHNYDLCETCYNANKHDINHSFKRFDCPDSVGAKLPPRLTSGRNQRQNSLNRIFLNKSFSSNIYGMRYKCNDCTNYDLCSVCYHGDRHDLSHSFIRIETPQCVGIDLPPRSTSRKCQLRGIMKGAKVIRGIDWDWDNQKDEPGVVLEIDHSSWRSIGFVKWPRGNTQLCRLGYKGHCDIQLMEAAPNSSHYYPEHLPILGQTDQMLQATEHQDLEYQEEHISDSDTDGTYLFENISLNETKKRSQLVGSSSENNPASDNATTSDERVKQLENRIAQIEESQTCAICLENKRNIVFLCGHGTCSNCANSLESCHLCRKTIEKKIRVY